MALDTSLFEIGEIRLPSLFEVLRGVRAIFYIRGVISMKLDTQKYIKIEPYTAQKW